MKLLKISGVLFTLTLVSLLILSGCRKEEKAEKIVLSIKGSDTMVNLAQKWAEEYMKMNDRVSIQVTGGGSGTGVAALLNGTTDIATSSRELKDAELRSATEKGINPAVFEVALDGIAVIVHPSNNVDNLTMQQVSDIFTGKIRNWKELGGNDAAITLYGRENSSGTYEFFKEHVLGKDERGVTKDYARNTQVLQGTAALGEAVARDVRGIGYGGVGYFAERNDVKILHIKGGPDEEAISPVENHKVNYDAIWDGSYSISRYLYCFVSEARLDKVKEFMDFILSDMGQDLVAKMEYIPLPEKKRKK